MKQITFSLSVAALVLAGCATSDDYGYSRYDRSMDRDVVVIVPDDERVHVREYSGWRQPENNMEPRVRGKHAEALGWNRYY